MSWDVWGPPLVVLGAGALLVLLAQPESIDAMRALWAPIGEWLLEVFAFVITIVLIPFEPIITEPLPVSTPGVGSSLRPPGWVYTFTSGPPGLLTWRGPAGGACGRAPAGASPRAGARLLVSRPLWRRLLDGGRMVSFSIPGTTKASGSPGRADSW